MPSEFTMMPSTVHDEDSLTLPALTQTSIKTGGNTVHPSGRLCSKLSKQSHSDKNGPTKSTQSGCKSELKVATTRTDSVISSSKLCSSSTPVV